MNCRRVNSLLSAYIDGELAGVEHLQIQRHLRECRSCSDDYESLLGTKRLLSNLRSAVPSADFETRILARIAQERSAPMPFARALAWWSVETAGWRWRLSLGTIGAAVALAALAAAVRPTPDDRLASRTLSAAQARPIASEPVVPLDDLRMLHETWQGPLGAGAHGIPVGAGTPEPSAPRFVPAFDRSTLTDTGPR